MLTRRVVLLGCASAGLCVLTAMSLAAQDRPNFSGTWVVERVDVQMPQGDAPRGQPGRRGGGGFGGGGFGRRGDGQNGRPGGSGPGRGGGALGATFEKGDRVSIRQTADALIVNDERRTRVGSYPFDQREASNPGAGDTLVKTKTRWEGVALVTESTQTLAGPQGERAISTREVRSLSADGAVMTLVVTLQNLPAARTTVTFARQGDAR